MIALLLALGCSPAPPTAQPEPPGGDTGVASDLDGDGWTAAEGDCDDSDASISPTAPDREGDGIDRNFDGVDGVDGQDLQTWQGDLTITTEATAAAFCQDYERVDGSLYLAGNELERTDDLGCLVEVKGDLVLSASQVERLTLGSLHTIGGELRLSGASALTDLHLPTLEEVGASLVLEDLPQLPRLEGVPELLQVGGLDVDDCARLTSLARLAGVELAGPISLRTTPLQSLDFLEGHEGLAEDLSLVGLPGLQTLELTELRELGGLLTVEDCKHLERISLPVLERAEEGLLLVDLQALTELELPATQSLGSLHLDGLVGLEALQLDALSHVGDLTVDDCTALQSLEASSLVSTAGGIKLSGLSALQTLDLSALAELEGNLHLSSNTGLQDLDGLAGLRTVLRDLELHHMDGLVDLDALAGLESVGRDLSIHHCALLSDADAWALVHSIGQDKIGGGISIHDNGG